MLKILSFLKTGKAIYVLAVFALIGGVSWVKFHIEELNEIIKAKERTIINKEALLITSKAQNEISKANLSECNAKIDLQNEKIARVAIENQKLRNIQPVIKKEIETRYIKIKPPGISSECKIKLEYYENLFKELGR